VTAMADGNVPSHIEGTSRQLAARPLSLRFHPDPLLREACDSVERFDSSLADLVDEMLTLMRTHNGIGLAGPQVGLTQRLFTAEIQGHAICLANPVIVAGGGSDRMVEGCLSLPRVQVDVKRKWHVDIEGFNARGRKQAYHLEGLWARVVQHEIDHLDGVLIHDYRRLRRKI
jgi:peptide deformylase